MESSAIIGATLVFVSIIYVIIEIISLNRKVIRGEKIPQPSNNENNTTEPINNNEPETVTIKNNNTMFANTWNQIIEWFKDRSERRRLVRGFNDSAREAFIHGLAPTLLKASFSRGVPSYHHRFSAWSNTGFRVQALTGRALTRDEMLFIGNVILNDEQLTRRLVALGWDTLEVHDDTGRYGCRWKLIDYVKINLMLQ